MKKVVALAVLLALAAAAPVPAAEPFEAQVAGVSALLRARLQAAKPPPPPALPQGTPQRLQRLFAEGWSASMRALRRSSCQALFERPGAPAEAPEETMRRTEYRFMRLRQGPTVGAQTNAPGSVFINTDGLFVTAESGVINLAGREYDLGTESQVRAMILLHELGHERGLFGADSGPLAGENAGHSLAVMAACLRYAPIYR